VSFRPVTPELRDYDV